MGAIRSGVDTLGLFDQFYAPLLHKFRARLRDEFAEQAELDPDAVEGIVDGATDDLLQQLIFLCTRTLVYEFHRWGRDAELDSPDGHAYYERFAERLGAQPGQRAILASYPALAELIDITIDRRIALLTEALSRYVADRTELGQSGVLRQSGALGQSGVLGESGLTGPETPRRIRCSSGDLHNGGRKVLLFEFESGLLVYKPRDLRTDEFVQAVLAEVNRDLATDERVRLPRTLVRENYGWQEFVTPVDNDDPDDVRRFFRRIGVFLGVFTALGSGDMHYENVIAARGEPFFIDLETFVQRRDIQHTPGTLYEAFFERVGRTVLGTMLLPGRLFGSVFDFDISGLGSARVQESERWQNYLLVDPGTDDIRFEKKKVQVEHSANVATLHHSPVNAADYGDDIRAGFRAAWLSLCHRREAIRSIIFAQEWSAMPVRQVLRPTAVYFRFLEASTHPRYLGSARSRRELLAKMGPNPGAPAELGDRVLQEEIGALAAGDIPYLAADFAGHDLIANTTATMADAYPRTLRDQVYEQFIENVGKPATENEYLIGAALLTSVADSWTTDEESRSHCLAELFEPADPLTMSRRIGDFLHDTALWQADRTRCGWIAPGFTGATELTLDLANFTLYEGGGTLLFLAELAKVTGDRRYADLVVAGVPEPERWPPTDPPRPEVCGFSGAGSTVYLLTRLATLLADASLTEARDEQLDRLERLDWSVVTKPDYVGGVAGLTVVLANLVERSGRTPAELILTKLAPVLTGLADRIEATSLAHGQVGAVLALGRAGHVLADGMLLDRARDILRRLLASGELFRGSRNWCWGSAGAVQATARAMLDVGLSRDEARSVLGDPIEALLREPPFHNGDLSLCHGHAGNAQAIGDACRLLGDGDGRRRANEQLLDALRTVPADGYRGGLSHSAGLPTFMLGLSGVGHALLAPTELPSPLLLEFEEASC